MMNLSCRLLLPALLLAVVLPARAGTRIEKSLKLEPGGRFVLDSSAGSVTVSGGPASGARVVITSNRDELESRYALRYEESPGLARVIAEKKTSGLLEWLRGESLHFEVQLPSRTQLEVQTGGGSISVSSISRDAKLHTSGGSIEVSGIGGRLETHTSGGSLDLKDVKGDILAHTSGGSISISGAEGRVDAETSGGSVEVRFAPGNSKGGRIETSGGAMEIAVDPKADLQVEASTSGGTVDTDLPIGQPGTRPRSEISGRLGKGGDMLRVHTSGGSIRILPTSH